MILPSRKIKTSFSFIICFGTCFGIDFWWGLASTLTPFWYPFGIQLLVFFAIDLVDCFGHLIFIDFDYKGNPKLKMVPTLIRRWRFWRFLGSLWLPFGSLLVQCWSFGVLFFIHFYIFLCSPYIVHMNSPGQQNNTL